MQATPIQIYSARHLIPIVGETLSPGALAVQAGRILEVGPPEALKRCFPEAELRDFPNHAILPGLVNAHADLSLTQYAKFPHPLPETKDGRFLLMAWIVNVSRFKAKLPIADQRTAVAEGLETAKRSGTTTLGDVCRFPVAVPLYRDSGLRVTVLAEIENLQRATAQEEFEQALALVDEIEHAGNPRLRPGLAPFAAYTLSKNMLRILASHAAQMRIPLHIVAALSFSEMEFFYDSQGEVTSVLFREAGWGEERIPPPHHMTPVQYLHEIGLLKVRPAIVGALHLGPTDGALLGRAECPLIFAPSAFEKLQVGEVPWDKVLQSSVPWALASWSRAAGSSLDLWDEMRAVLYRLEGTADRSAAAEAILRAATLGGARALGLESEIGSLQKDKRADFLAVESPEDSGLAAGLIEGTRPDRIAASFVEGRELFSHQ